MPLTWLLRAVLCKHRLECRFLCSKDTSDVLAILDNLEGWHGFNPVVHGSIRAFVYVDLDIYRIRINRCKFFELWRDGLQVRVHE